EGDAAVLTEPPLASEPSPFGTSPFLQSMEMKWESWQPGLGVCWLRIGDCFVDGEATSPSVRADIAADLVMTGGGLLPVDRYHVVNADLCISFTRPPVGQDIRVSSVVRVDAHGYGMTDGVMHDRLGRFASVTKALLVDHVA
ncbi:MAG: acyl-CoA thioesterase, partial [Acidimicrobiia bacterium]|nr:acyl-CoA thioesterase [Acidimicrobiia bacterium]